MKTRFVTTVISVNDIRLKAKVSKWLAFERHPSVEIDLELRSRSHCKCRIMEGQYFGSCKQNSLC